MGTTPGGELGGTWASPTVDSSIFNDEYIELEDTFLDFYQKIKLQNFLYLILKIEFEKIKFKEKLI